METALTFLTRCDKDGGKFWGHTIVDGKTWVLHKTPEIKHHSVECHVPSLHQDKKKDNATTTQHMKTDTKYVL